MGMFCLTAGGRKAVKAVFQKMGGLAWGHSVFELLRALSQRVEVSGELLDCARTLDRYYIYPR